MSNFSLFKKFIIDLLSTKQNAKSPDAVWIRNWRFDIDKEKVNKFGHHIERLRKYYMKISPQRCSAHYRISAH